MNTSEIRRAYLDFFRQRDHVVIPRAALVPQEDPTTLFTGSGMRPLIRYLLGEPHPAGNRLVDSQTCFRAEDIDEVGDTRHTTFFEMLGNWSLGSYFKEEQLRAVFTFLTDVLGLDPRRLYVTVFAGAPRWDIPRDDESAALWTDLFASKGIDPKISQDAATAGMGDAHIAYYGENECWWSRAGRPDSMPVGEPGGPDSEVFFEFPQVTHGPAIGPHCHPHCDCGRSIEIGNSVFMQYVRTEDGFADLTQRNVDFGGGLERLAMACADVPDMFQVDLLKPLVDAVGPGAPVRSARIIADHVRALVFLAADGVRPANTAQSYVMRRLARPAIRQGLAVGIDSSMLARLTGPAVTAYGDAFDELVKGEQEIREILDREETPFRRTLSRGVREFRRVAPSGGLTGDVVFTLFHTYGFPPELSVEEATHSATPIDSHWQVRFDELMSEQRARSKSAAKGLFKGGLADHSAATTRLHTATHLLYKALRLTLGDHVTQRGSNITPERLRFDFSHPAKMTPEQLAEAERIVNEQIARDWPMVRHELPTATAFEEGAIGAFGDRYGDTVQVYTAGDPDGDWYSKETCGGPHVERTATLGRFRIIKEESSSAGVRRIRAVLEPTP